MSHGKDAARDISHGRRGGGWLPAGYQPPGEPRLCVVCDGPILSNVGADRHATCTPPTETDPQEAMF